MKYSMRLIGGLLLAVIATIGLQAVAHAADDETITDAQLVEVRSHCSEIQATLNRIHANDALLRVNRGKLYEHISTKLMAPLNSRIALNRLDGSSLVSITTSYEVHLAAFRTAYQSYEVTLSDTMKINCVSQPARFYDKLQQAREKRVIVYNRTQELANNILEYKKAFDVFAVPYLGAKS